MSYPWVLFIGAILRRKNLGFDECLKPNSFFLPGRDQLLITDNERGIFKISNSDDFPEVNKIISNLPKQIQLEFTKELQQAQQMQQMLQQQPQNAQLVQQATQLTNMINARKAVLIAEMTKDYMEEEEKILGLFNGDPLIKLKAREVDLRAADLEQQKKNEDQRLNLDKAKALMNQENQEDKLEQAEQLAKMRANVSLAKQGMADASKINDFGRNFGKK